MFREAFPMHVTVTCRVTCALLPTDYIVTKWPIRPRDCLRLNTILLSEWPQGLLMSRQYSSKQQTNQSCTRGSLHGSNWSADLTHPVEQKFIPDVRYLHYRKHHTVLPEVKKPFICIIQRSTLHKWFNKSSYCCTITMMHYILSTDNSYIECIS